MKQTALFKDDYFPPPKTQKVVNVASVKHLSPFRYPGGKTWFVPEMRRRLLEREKRPNEFAEIFAGGSIVGLTVAAENLADKVTLIELDADVAAVWNTVFSDDAEWLASEILSFDMNLENAKKCIEKQPKSTKDRAFQTIIKNRTFHSGILASGSGFLKSGENGKGVLSRWYPQTIAKRIKNLIPLRHKITFIEGDALEYLSEDKSSEDIMYFIDPPYTASTKSAGKRLYTHYKIDHQKLFDLCSESKRDFIMTYDDDDAVIKMAKEKEFIVSKIPMRGTHHRKVYELVISSAK